MRLARSASARPSATRASATEASTDASAAGSESATRAAAASWARRMTARRAASAAACCSASNCRSMRADARLLGAHPLLRGLEPQARLDLGLARALERGERAVARGGVEHRPRRRLEPLQRELRLVGGAFGVGDALLGVRGGLLEACRLGLAPPRPARGRGSSCSVRRASCASNSRRAASACLACSFDRSRMVRCSARSNRDALELGAHLLEPGAGAVALGEELDAALLAAGAAADDVAADDGAVLRDDRRGPPRAARAPAPRRGRRRGRRR